MTLEKLSKIFYRIHKIYCKMYIREPEIASAKFQEWVDKFWTNYSGGYYGN